MLIQEPELNYKTGWIRIYRSMKNHWLFPKNKPMTNFEAWITILIEVNHSDEKTNIGYNIIDCKRGEKLDTWGKLFNWNKSKVRRFFNLLQKDSMIVLKGEQKTTRLIVCNYESYQSERNGSETEVKRKRNASETQVTPIKEVKNDKEDKEVNKRKNSLLIFDEFRKLYLGVKKGNITEFDNFTKKIKDWEQVLPTLKIIIENQMKLRLQKKANNEFTPEWKHLSTWINNRCWEEEISIFEKPNDGLAD